MLIAFNKPYGALCQFTDAAHGRAAGRAEAATSTPPRPTLAGFGLPAGVYAAGRLDFDSEGLLLLTNNGRLQAQIAEPKFGKEKTYWAQLEGSPDEAKLNLLRQKMDLGDFIARPARVRVLDAAETAALWPRQPPIRVRKSVPDFWLEIALSEGKNRQVRRMTAKAGYPCLRLVRVAIGRLNLFEQQLALGQWQYSNEKP